MVDDFDDDLVIVTGSELAINLGQLLRKPNVNDAAANGNDGALIGWMGVFGCSHSLQVLAIVPNGCPAAVLATAGAIAPTRAYRFGGLEKLIAFRRTFDEIVR